MIEVFYFVRARTRCRQLGSAEPRKCDKVSLSFPPSPGRVSEALQQIFSNRAQIRGEQLDLERKLKENELRQRYCEEDNLQVQCFCAKEKTEKVPVLTLLHTDSNIPAEAAAESSICPLWLS